MAKKMAVKRRVRLILLNDEQKILLARQASRRLWHFVGGEIDPGETPQAALYRETKEEANIKCCELKLFHTEYIRWADHTEVIDCFLGQTKTTDQMKPDGEEIDALGWVYLHNTPKFKLTGTTKLLLQNISIISLFL